MTSEGNEEMYVLKRSGDLEIISFDKILKRVKKLGAEAHIQINFTSLVVKVIDQLYNKISTHKIDELTAEQCASLAGTHPDYDVLAGRVIISNHHKNTEANLYNVVCAMNAKEIVNAEFYEFVCANYEELESFIDYSRDYLIDYFGFKTLERSYLTKINGKIIERPQHMWMRVAICLHANENNLTLVKETYDLLSLKYFTHATPTLFNAGTKKQQLSSCFLLAMEEDSVDGIYSTLADCAKISKWSGGIGLHIHNVRANNSYIKGTNGYSTGIVPMLKVFNNTAKYIDQCVVPQTIIYTSRGAIEIQNCVANETEILNKTGGIETIATVLEHTYNGEMMRIKTDFSAFELQITPEHPIYALQNYTNADIINCINQNVFIKPEWVDAKNLNVGDFIAISIPTYEKDVLNITELDCYLYGLIIGGRCIIGRNPTTKNIVLYIRDYDNEMRTFFMQYLTGLCIQYLEIFDGDYNGVEITLSGENRLVFTHADIFDVNDKIRFHYKWLNLPTYKCKFILKGIINSYYYTTIFMHMHKYSNSMSLLGSNYIKITTSKENTEAIRYLCLRLHILTKGTADGKEIEIPKTKDICDFVGIDRDELEFNFYVYKNFLLTKINEIGSAHYEGVLYDLQMTNQHNYLLHSGLVHNGGGRRNGSFAIYLETWHADIVSFLDLKKNHGDEESRARDLFYSLWVTDLFMERVEKNEEWTLFCPNECKGLADLYGEDFNNLYLQYEAEGKGREKISARALWFKILDAQMETGTPYILYKDAVNKKCNQNNLGTIKSSNLCCEITLFTNNRETGVCNLASIALPTFVQEDANGVKYFNYEKLHETTKVVTNNLNKIIDINFYPTIKCKRSNLLHRPIGIGVQGLADTFILLDIAFYSEEAKELNKLIFETIYHASLEKSNEIAIERKEKGMLFLKEIYDFNREYYCCRYTDEEVCDTFSNEPRQQGKEEIKKLRPIYAEFANLQTEHIGSYSSFEGSAMSKGILQFDMWGVVPSERYDWDKLRNSIITHGIRNSLLCALMPTASTSQILGFNECFEPITSNIYSRRTIAGEFVVANKYLMRELIELGLWNIEMKNNIIANQGSIQHINVIPQKIRDKYKIVWEIPMTHLIDMSVDRGAYICQTQSLNLWLEDPSYKSLTAMHFYGWKKGLKTGIYYLRRKAKHQAQQFTIEPTMQKTCDMCSS